MWVEKMPNSNKRAWSLGEIETYEADFHPFTFKIIE